MASKLIDKYMREERLPHIWCGGCGHGILMRDVAQAIENVGLEKKDVVIVSGIGCSCMDAERTSMASGCAASSLTR